MSDFLDELASYLEDQSIGIYDTAAGRNIFVDSTPAEPTNLVALLALPGPTIGPQRQVGDLQFPRFQIYVRNAVHDTGSAKLQAVRTALHGKYGIILPSWRILRIHADQEGGWIGKDGQGRHEFSVNIAAEIDAETT